jgi:ribosomal protein L20A (L18A)
MMKTFRIEINTTSITWESCYVVVEAETKEKALELFDEDPNGYDWDNWVTHDSEMKHWDIESIEEVEDAEVQDSG